MSHTSQVQELDRNMDAVFDALAVLNATMSAIVQSLPGEMASAVSRHLDQCLDALPQERNPPGMTAQLTLNGWRNMAAQRAGLAPRSVQTSAACRCGGWAYR